MNIIPETTDQYLLLAAWVKYQKKIIFKYLFNYLQEYEILTKYQSGFRPHDSTINQLLEIYHIIIGNLDKRKDKVYFSVM